MNHIVTIAVAVDVCLFAFAIYILVRNHKVFNLRKTMIKRVFEFADWQWRAEKYREIDYRQMMWSFKWPITAKTFYKDTSFLEPSESEKLGFIKSPFQLK